MEIIAKLKEKLGSAVQENVPLAPYTTFKLGGPARYFFVAKNNEEIKQAAEAALALNLPIFILGGGSNILVSDHGFNGLVVKMENNKAEVINGDTIRAEAGAKLNKVAALALRHGLTGFEWAAGIPGTIGGAVRGNAGAFGKSTGDDLIGVQALKITAGRAGLVTLAKKQCEFNYRESIFKQTDNLIILSADFKLKAGNKEDIKNLAGKQTLYRRTSHPHYPSAGCSFKNIIITEEIKRKLKEIDPEVENKIKGDPSHPSNEHGINKGGASKIGAGWFIDQAGLKGYKIGGAQVSGEHANFVVKVDDTARAEHVIMLISYVKQQVRDKFGIQLQEEVQYVGF